MIAFDTNVLVRLAVGDDAAQLAAARAALDAAASADETVFLAVPVLCELAWALRARYAVPGAEIAAALRALVDEPRFAIDRRDAVIVALERFEAGDGDFPDHLIAELGRLGGARTTLTFDRGLRRAAGFTRL